MAFNISPGRGPNPAAASSMAAIAAARAVNSKGSAGGTAGSKYNPLAVLNPKQIRTQAQNAVAANYAPAYESITQQSNEAKNLAAKRDSDDQAYSAWLTTQTDALNASQNTQDTNFQNLIHGIQGAQADMYGQPGEAASTGLTASGQAQLGAAPSNSWLDQQQAADTDKVSNGSVEGLQQQSLGDALLKAATSNDIGTVNNDLGSNSANLQTTLKSLSDTLNTDKAKQAADTLTQINTLTGQQSTLALNNRNFANTQHQQSVAQANANRTFAAQQAQQKYSNAATAKQQAFSDAASLKELGLTSTKDLADLQHIENEDGQSSKNYQLALAKYKSSVQQENFDDNTKGTLAAATLKHLEAEDQHLHNEDSPTGNGTTFLPPASQATRKQQIQDFGESVASALAGQVVTKWNRDSSGNITTPAATKKVTPQELRAMLQNGGQVSFVPASSSTHKPVTLSTNAILPSDAIKWSGFQLGAHGALTAADVRLLVQNQINPSGYRLQPGVAQQLAAIAKTKTH